MWEQFSNNKWPFRLPSLLSNPFSHVARSPKSNFKVMRLVVQLKKTIISKLFKQKMLTTIAYKLNNNRFEWLFDDSSVWRFIFYSISSPMTVWWLISVTPYIFTLFGEVVDHEFIIYCVWIIFLLNEIINTFETNNWSSNIENVFWPTDPEFHNFLNLFGLQFENYGVGEGQYTRKIKNILQIHLTSINRTWLTPNVWFK